MVAEEGGGGYERTIRRVDAKESVFGFFGFLVLRLF